MSRTHISLNGKMYEFARSKDGGRVFSIESRQWQPGDPAGKEVAVWEVDGPQFFTNEDVTEQQPAGPLGIDYTDGTDSRWSDIVCLGPAFTTVTLTGNDAPHPETLLNLSALLDQNTGLDGSPVAGNVTAIAATQGSTVGEYYDYWARGNYVTKRNSATDAVVETHSFLDTVTDVIATQTPAALREVSAALQSTSYQVANPIASGAGDTWAANTSAEVARVFGTDPQRVVEGQVSTGQVNWRGNILTSVITMGAPAWNTVASIVGSDVTPTGFTTDSYRWVCQTSKGPYYIDPNLGSLYQLLPSLDSNTETRGAFYWEYLGVVYGTRYGARWQKANQGRSFGVETFEGNRSTVQGYQTAAHGSPRWLYQAVLNTITGTTWILAWHPDNREQRPNRVLSPFVIGKIPSSGVCRAMRWIGTANQSRTTQELLLGNGTNGLAMIAGETPQEIDDPAYRYITSGTAYFTELRRYPYLLKDVEAIEFESANCTTTATLTVALVVSGDAAGATTITLNSSTAGVNDTVKTNGYQRRLFVDNSGVPLTTATGRRLKPQIAFTGVSVAVTNLMLNPSFEVDDTHWGAQSSTISRDATTSKFGTASEKVVTTNANASGIRCQIASADQFTVTVGTAYTASAYARLAVAGSLTLGWNFNWYDASHAFLTNTYVPVTLNTIDWSQRLSASATAPANAAFCSIDLNTSGAQGVVTFYVDGAQFETGSTVSTYCDGTQGYGYSWNGAANNSTSSRAVMALTSPQIIGPIRLYYTLRPQQIDEITVTLQLEDTNEGTAYDKWLALAALQNNAPLVVDDDYWGNTYEVRVADVGQLKEITDGGGSVDRPKDGYVYQTTVKLHKWLTAGNGIVPS